MYKQIMNDNTVKPIYVLIEEVIIGDKYLTFIKNFGNSFYDSHVYNAL